MNLYSVCSIKLHAASSLVSFNTEIVDYNTGVTYNARRGGGRRGAGGPSLFFRKHFLPYEPEIVIEMFCLSRMQPQDKSVIQSPESSRSQPRAVHLFTYPAGIRFWHAK